LGFIQKECPSCNGIGFITKASENDDKINDKSILSTVQEPKPIKRRGRPPRKIPIDNNR
jgi:hypothetical protein